jgi:flagellar motor component MotA
MDSFKWKKKNQEIAINTLNDLLKIVKNIPLNEIDEEVKINVIDRGLLNWLKNNFPKKLILTTKLENMLQEFSPQQIRELLIKELENNNQ